MISTTQTYANDEHLNYQTNTRFHFVIFINYQVHEQSMKWKVCIRCKHVFNVGSISQSPNQDGKIFTI